MDERNDILYAFYDLAVAPTTFDFIKFLILSEIERKRIGCSSLHVVIVPGFVQGFRKGDLEDYRRSGASDYDVNNLNWRLSNIVIPCCWHVSSCQQITVCASREEAYTFYASLTKHVFPKGYTVRFPKKIYAWRNIAYVTSKGLELPTIQATFPARHFVNKWIQKRAAGRKIITITLRESSWHHERNSNLSAWAMFARGLNSGIYYPIFIRDTENSFKSFPPELAGLTVFSEVSWNIELRIALYELSYLNMFTNGGPATLCRLNKKARSIVFKLIGTTYLKDDFFRYVWDIEPGSQPKYANSFQRLVWEDDRFTVIQREFDKMCDVIERVLSKE